MKSQKNWRNDPFDTWWNERHFHTDDPLHQTYRKLHAAGADLRYIDFICAVFVYGSRFDPIVQRKTLRQARRRMRKASAKRGIAEALKRQSERLYSIVEAPEQSPSAPMVLFGELQATLELLYKVPDSRPRDLANYIGTLVEDRTSTEYQNLPARAVTYLEALARVCERLNLLRLPEDGQPPDPLGNFILMAVSEHLREQAHSRHPYGLAAELLRKLRGEPKPTSLSARVRVHKLKAASLREWEEILSFLKEQYRQLKDDGKQLLLSSQD